MAQKNDVFISYAHTDIDFTRRLKQELEKHCIKWYVYKYTPSLEYDPLVCFLSTIYIILIILFNQLSIYLFSWMDEWRLEAGDDWRGNIGEGIIACKVLIFVASPKSIQVLILLYLLLSFCLVHSIALSIYPPNNIYILLAI